MSAIETSTGQRTGLDSSRFHVHLDDDDTQTLLLRYPPATPADEYLQPAVKIEAGAKSALDPNSQTTIRPYADLDAPGLDLSLGNVTTVDPERTFLDKVVILHGPRRWFERRGGLRGGGQRPSEPTA